MVLVDLAHRIKRARDVTTTTLAVQPLYLPVVPAISIDMSSGPDITAIATTTHPDGSFTIRYEQGGAPLPNPQYKLVGSMKQWDPTLESPPPSLLADCARKTPDPEQWSARVRAGVAASAVLNGPPVYCQGEYDEED